LAHSAAGPIIRQMNYLDVEKTPAQCHHDDQNHGDRAEITERLSSRRLLSRFGDHLEFALKIAFARSPLHFAGNAVRRLSRIDHFTNSFLLD
jgi:hypothetical protein